MNELQKHLLDMLVWFHTFCNQHCLRYYMIGGTMLGAIRHNGFIPWDDDIDVGMPRADYEKLEQIFREETNDRYVLETPRTEAADYFYPFSKIYDTQTTLVENTRMRIKRGIYLDIFPLDGLGSTEEECKHNYHPIHWKYNLLLTRVTGIRRGRSKIKNAAVMIARLIPKLILDNKKLLLSLENDCQKYDFDNCAWVGNLVGAWRFKEVLPRRFFGEPTLYKFEDQMFYGPELADEYLTNIYGDWRQLPPIEKRISHHDFIELDLHKSYFAE